MDSRAPGGGRRGFTLTELLTVLGLLALLAALFLPVVGRVRATAAAAGCLANLKQMGTAWTMSVTEEHGRLPDYVWDMSMAPEVAWRGYWTGTMERSKLGANMLCPSASQPNPSGETRGYGTAEYAWNGQFAPYGTAIHLNPETFRQGSYGYNRWLTEGGFGRAGKGVYLSDLQGAGNVPVFIDCAYADTGPLNETAESPVELPPGLGGGHAAPGKPEHWKFLFARHGRGVNVYRADGSAAWVALEELYLLDWKSGWRPYRLDLPLH
jgi:prepilin-type N-terminal cleavage/methylation domain-containing protein